MKYLIDSNVFYAMTDQDDSTHAAAKKLWARIEKDSEYELLCTSYVFEECLTLMSQNINKQTALRVGFYLLSHTTILYPSEHQLLSALEIFRMITSKNLSFCDAMTLSIAAEEQVDIIVSFDRDLKKWKGKWQLWGEFVLC